MAKEINKYLEDIYTSISQIEETCDRFGRRFDVFLNDYVFRKFVERNIEIMGEAMNHILKIKPDVKITDARRIVATRNFVIHGYDILKPEMLWAIVINHLPILKGEIERLIETDSNPESSI